jgi:dienelactone hydrolase
MRRGIALAAAALSLVPATAARAGFAEDEAANYSKIEERARYEHMLPEYRALLLQESIENEAEVIQMRLADPERQPSNLCGHPMDGCAGDVRLYDWGEQGYGIEIPVLFTARSGATLSGRVWATRSGPRKRPGVVITTGSIQAPERLYLFAAQTLAKRGYVVLTYDVQGQGLSDTRGERPDEMEGVPAQQPANFVNGTEDALDFLLSTPKEPYVPRPSDTTGTVHSEKQERRVAAGLNAAYNPLHDLLDPKRIGIVGHSLGAYAVSKVASYDRRVDAVVAWDNLRTRGGSAGTDPNERIPPRVPALGMSAD